MKKKSFEEARKLDRKSVERNRRLHMKSLCLKLFSLIPKNASSTLSKQRDHLNLATEYIKEMKKKVEGLKRRKKQMLASGAGAGAGASSSSSGDDHTSSSEKKDVIQKLPIIEIRQVNDSIAEIVVICGADIRSVFYQLINIVEEEGAQVVNASSAVVGDKIFHTVHSNIKSPRIGLDSSRMLERLKNLVQEE